MPQNITIAAFVFGAVLLLIALLSGGFKIFGVEISGTTSSPGRIIAGVAGTLLIIIGLYSSVEKRPTPQPLQEEKDPKSSAQRTPSPVKEPQGQLAPGIGTLKIPNLKTRTVEVYSQDSSGDHRYQKGYAGTLSPERTALQVPAGTYKLKFERFFLEHIVVKSGEETVLER
jgi:hypothetical protein